MKNPMLSRPFWSRNVNSVKTTVYYRPKKSGCLVFSSIFHEKITALMHIFCQKTFLSPKKITTVLPYFVKKLSILSKTQCSNVIFFQIFMKNPLLSCPYLVKKKVTSVKTALQYKPKKSKGCPFFSPDFSRKKSLLSCPYFVKKTSILSKTLVLSYHFFNFFIKNPCSHSHIWSTKRQFYKHYPLWAKKVDFTKKSMLSCPSLVNKLPFSKKDATPIPIFCQKNVHSLKNVVFSCHFFQT